MESSQYDQELRVLFDAVDSDHSGFIGLEEVTEICLRFGSSEVDAIEIFKKLDRDGDNKVSFEDFKMGFDDYEKSMIVATSPRHTKTFEMPTMRSTSCKIPTSPKRKSSTVLSLNGQSVESETIISDLIDKINRLKEDNSFLSSSLLKDKKELESQIAELELEMDNQVKEVELRVKKKAEEDFENERKSLRQVIKEELDELHVHLDMFKKVDSWLKANQEKDDSKMVEYRKKLEEAISENRQIKTSLMDTQTSISMMRSDLAQVRSQYELKCQELENEREKVIQSIQEQELLSRQLYVLQDFNRRIQDSNDAKIASISRSSSRTSSFSSKKRGSVIGDYLPSHGLMAQGHGLLPFNRRSGLLSTEEEDLDNNAFQSLELDDEDSGLSSKESISHRHLILDPSCLGCHHPLPTSDTTRSKSADCLCSSRTSNIQNHTSNASSLSMDDRRLNRTFSRTSQASTTRRDLRESGKEIAIDEATPKIFVTEVTGSPHRTFKVIFVGDAGVGKSSFILRVVEGQFVPLLSSTLGVDFNVRSLNVNGHNVAVQLWDTAGQERFRSITRTYFRKVDGVVLVYDVSSETSFINVRRWMNDIHEQTDNEIPVMIVGNKTDLREVANAHLKTFVSQEDGFRMAQETRATFLEVSVKNGRNIDQALGSLVLRMIDNEEKMIRQSGLRLSDGRRFAFGCCSK